MLNRSGKSAKLRWTAAILMTVIVVALIFNDNMFGLLNNVVSADNETDVAVLNDGDYELHFTYEDIADRIDIWEEEGNLEPRVFNLSDCVQFETQEDKDRLAFDESFFEEGTGNVYRFQDNTYEQNGLKAMLLVKKTMAGEYRSVLLLLNTSEEDKTVNYYMNGELEAQYLAAGTAPSLPVNTEEPGAGEAPVASEEPENTNEPESSLQPEITIAPDTDQTKDEISGGSQTMEPVNTPEAEPDGTGEPGPEAEPTEEPANTKEPDPTEEPADTKEAEPTEAPADIQEAETVTDPPGTPEAEMVTDPVSTPEAESTEAPASTIDPSPSEVPPASDEPQPSETPDVIEATLPPADGEIPDTDDSIYVSGAFVTAVVSAKARNVLTIDNNGLVYGNVTNGGERVLKAVDSTPSLSVNLYKYYKNAFNGIISDYNKQTMMNNNSTLMLLNPMNESGLTRGHLNSTSDNYAPYSVIQGIARGLEDGVLKFNGNATNGMNIFPDQDVYAERYDATAIKLNDGSGRYLSIKSDGTLTTSYQKDDATSLFELDYFNYNTEAGIRSSYNQLYLQVADGSTGGTIKAVSGVVANTNDCWERYYIEKMSNGTCYFRARSTGCYVREQYGVFRANAGSRYQATPFKLESVRIDNPIAIKAYKNIDFTPFLRQDPESPNVYQFNSDDVLVRRDSSSSEFKLTQSVNPQSRQGIFPFLDASKQGDSYNYYEAEDMYHFGMDFTINFTMPENGKVDGKDMEFSFTGDDDVWVFIDGKLALDMGGLHQKAEGTINFTTGVITYKDPQGNPAVKSKYNGYTYAKNNNWNLKWYLYDDLNQSEKRNYDNVVGIDRAAGQEHTLQLFYMERCPTEANCSFRMNLPVIESNSVTVAKVVEGLEGNTEETFDFEVWAGSSGDVQTFEKAGEINGVPVNGTGSLKLGPKDKYVQIREKGSGGTTSWSQNNVVMDTGKVSPVYKVTDGRVYAVCINSYSTGSLTVQKTFDSEEARELAMNSDARFEFEVTISGRGTETAVLGKDNNYMVTYNNLNVNDTFRITELDYTDRYYSSELSSFHTLLMYQNQDVTGYAADWSKDFANKTIEGRIGVNLPGGSQGTTTERKWQYTEDGGVTWKDADASEIPEGTSETDAFSVTGYYEDGVWKKAKSFKDQYNNDIYYTWKTNEIVPYTACDRTIRYAYNGCSYTMSQLEAKCRKEGISMAITRYKVIGCYCYYPVYVLYKADGLVCRHYEMRQICKPSDPEEGTRVPVQAVVEFTNTYQLKKAAIALNKELKEADLENTAFLFRLTNMDENSPGAGSIAYASVEIPAGWMDIGNVNYYFEDLPMGDYLVEEIDQKTYEIESTKVQAGGSNDYKVKKDNSAVIYLNDDASTVIVTVVNRKAGSGYFTSSSIAVNKAEWNKGKINFTDGSDE